jgi:hypothetical protein
MLISRGWMRAILDIAKEALAITGFVALMMLVIEYLNVLTKGVWQLPLARHRWGQYLLAALLGALPGCLGAFAVVGMFMHGILTPGAVIAAMIATMGDEAFVMLAMIPKQAVILTGILFLLGMGVGAASDILAGQRLTNFHKSCGKLKLHRDVECRCFAAMLAGW